MKSSRGLKRFVIQRKKERGSVKTIDRSSCFRFNGAAGPAVRGFQRMFLNVGAGEAHHGLR